MPHLILSDIHGNLEALTAVLADAQGLYGQIYCLGDLVGYGADPNPVVEWARNSVAAIVRGNHDKISVGLDSLENYNPGAQASALWTREALTPESRAYLERLPRGPLRLEAGGEGFDLVHGSPADEDEYLIFPDDVYRMVPYLDTRLSFFGHTHVQGGFLIARNGVRRLSPNGTLVLDRGYLYLVNPGSVGQPRDGNPWAAYVLYYPEDGAVEYRRAEYDVEAAAEKIRAAGLPEPLAARLFAGA